MILFLSGNLNVVPDLWLSYRAVEDNSNVEISWLPVSFEGGCT
jgi:hypothetical protein